MTDPRRVLIVSYYFPPREEVGALRAAKFAKYLPEFGGLADVLTPGHGDSIGSELRADGGMVERTPMGLGPRQAYLRLRDRFGRLAPGCGGAPDLTFAEKDVDARGLREHLARACRSLLWCPDDAIGWWWPAIRAGRRLLRRRHYQAIVTTGPPPTTHVVGLALARGGLRWIADFRDPWVNNPGKPRFVRSPASDAIDALGEQAVVGRAHRIVVGTTGLRDELERRYPHLRGRVAFIPAGVDGDDFAGIARVCLERFRLLHAGTVYYRRSPAPLFQAVAALLDRGQIPRDEIEIMLVGRSGDGIEPAALAARYGVDDVLRVAGPLPRRQALELMTSAGALVILAQDQPHQVPAKVFEYLAAGPPILAVTGAGATRDTLAACGADRAACSEGGPALEAGVLNAYRGWREQRRQDHHGNGRRMWHGQIPPELDRRHLTGQLAALLDESLR